MVGVLAVADVVRSSLAGNSNDINTPLAIAKIATMATMVTMVTITTVATVAAIATIATIATDKNHKARENMDWLFTIISNLK